MRREQHGNTTVQRYDGIADMANSIRTECPVQTDWFWRWAKQHAKDDGVDGIIGCRTAADAISSTWHAGIATVENMLTDIGADVLPTPKSRRRVARWSDDGDEFCRDRAESGFPAWRGTYREMRTGPQVITIVADMATPARRDSSEILWRGAAAILLTQICEQAGYRVELVAADHSVQTVGDTNVIQVVHLKEADEPLDVATLIAAVSGWGYRTTWMSALGLEGMPNNTYGTVRPLDDVIGLVTDSDTVHIAEDLWDREAAVEWVRSKLAELQ